MAIQPDPVPEIQKLLFSALLLLQHQLHQCLGVLARDQHVFIYIKFQSHKFLAAQDLLQRNTGGTLFDHFPISPDLFLHLSILF